MVKYKVNLKFKEDGKSLLDQGGWKNEQGHSTP